MNWNPKQLLDNFVIVAELAGVKMRSEAIQIEILTMPHRPPKGLPASKMAVYVFSDKERVLKVGKVGSNSGARYTSQHYNAKSANSTLAGSLLKDKEYSQKYQLNEDNVSRWIKENTNRVNYIVDANVNLLTLNLLEAFAQCWLHPYFEGPTR